MNDQQSNSTPLVLITGDTDQFGSLVGHPVSVP
jgi:hypothetical protein